MDTENLISIPQFAKDKGCSRQTIYQQIKNGNLKSVSILGKTLLIKCPENEAWNPGDNNGRPKRKGDK